VLPGLVLGVLFVLMGIAMINSNGKRPAAFQRAYERDSAQFLFDEKQRVEEFQILYPISLGVSAVCFLLTLFAFVWSKNPTFQAIAIVLSVFGVALIVIDYFSKERAAIYYEHILQQLQ
jgi:drug/metabolite transporter (DMT)-like permease